ncbi:hypothetical protein [Pseudophaeobacter sp.]
MSVSVYEMLEFDVEVERADLSATLQRLMQEHFSNFVVTEND